ncbi:MAG: beta-glucosidase BglX [Lachnospiraceae bacterium]
MEQEKLIALLQDMSLEEKINQLFQVHGNFFEGDSIATGPAAEQGFSEKAIREAGSVLGSTGSSLLKRIQDKQMEKQPHHIPLLFMADIINGYKTIFPIPLAQGAAFHEEVARTGAEIAAKEVSAAGVHITFSPMVDLVRDARWGRVMESNGEDVYLNSVYAKALVEGYQGKDPKQKGKIGACVKHFAAYGAPTGGRDYNNVELSERTLRDDYLPAYEAAVKAGALLVMTSFNTLNRIPSSANQWLMRQVLREEMGFKGVLISDWAAIEEIERHDLAADKKEAAVLALKAGTDIDMMTNCYCAYLKEAIEAGEVSESLLDEAVLRVLELKNTLGLFENPYKDADEEEEKRCILCEEHRRKSKEAAEETFVLLENEGMLPLRETEQVAFIGPYVAEKNILGFWSIFGEAKDAVSIREGVEKRPSVKATFDKGCEILAREEWVPGFDSKAAAGNQEGTDLSPEELLEQAIRHAKAADKVVLCLGEHVTQSGEGGSRAEITLPKLQLELLRKISEVNENIVVVLFNGRPLDLREVKELSKAILVAWMPGTEGGNAIAEVLYGDVSPNGKLPMSFPYCVGQVPVFYAEFHTGRQQQENMWDNRFQSRYIDIPNAPLYPFGYGLSYTEFSYGDLQLMTGEEADCLQVSVPVTNTGTCEGAEVVQMYLRDDKASVVRPVRELKGFQKIWLKPGETEEVVFTITEEMLRFHDIHMEYRSEPGSFTVFVGSDSTTDRQAKFYLDEATKFQLGN